jgi:LysM repeat protein
MRRNLVNVLLGLAAIGAVVMVYNAFLNSNNDTENNASSKLASYLALDKAEKESTSSTVATSDETKSEESTSAQTPSTETSTTNTPEESDTDTTATSETPAASTGTAKPETVYTVKEGDTYGCIAEKYYGSYENYVNVMAANPVYTEGFTEYELHVGAKLVLPALDAAAVKPASSLCS